MEKRSKEFKWFTIFDYEKEQEYLRNKHKDGWELIKAQCPGIYYFQKCEPEDVVYQLDYYKDADKSKGEYIQMFTDCGWEYVDEMVGFRYFRKPVAVMSEEEEIFNDDASKSDMLERVYKGRMRPLRIYTITVLCFILLVSVIAPFCGDFVKGFSMGILPGGIFLLVLMCVLMANYRRMYRNYKE